MRPCWFHPEALVEADAAATFYKAQQPELELRFLEALNDTIVRIRRNPPTRNAAHLISCRYADKQQTQRYFAAVQPRANRRRAGRRAGSDESR